MQWTEPAKFAKQMIDFQKTAFERTFDAIVVLQDQAERMTSALVDQATWLPEEGREAIDNWIKSYKKGRDDYKKMIMQGFENVEKFF